MVELKYLASWCERDCSTLMQLSRRLMAVLPTSCWLLDDDVIVQGSQAGHDDAGVYTILGSYKKPLLQLIIPPKLQAVGHGATQPAHLLPAFI